VIAREYAVLGDLETWQGAGAGDGTDLTRDVFAGEHGYHTRRVRSLAGVDALDLCVRIH
jgi:hypothetical protein